MARTPQEKQQNGFTIFVQSKDNDTSQQKKTTTTKVSADERGKLDASLGSSANQPETHTGFVVVATENENDTRLHPGNKAEMENAQLEIASQTCTQRSDASSSEERSTVHRPQSGRGSNAPDYMRSNLLETKDKKFKNQRHSLWHRLRSRHVHMGVVEVTKDHNYHSRLQAISAGVSNTQTDSPHRSGPLEKPGAEHYREVTEQRLTLEGKDNKEVTCVFESYAPSVFATIRRAVSVDEEAYTQSLTTRDYPYLEYISNSGGGQDFLLSPDTHYIIKTNSESDVKFLLSFLEKYLQHFLSHPHSLLVKYLGCYAVKFKGNEKTYFLVMQNVFYSVDGMDDRFDVKGCTACRYQKPDPPETPTITVLKDQNFGQENLQLGTNREWFIDQITADSTFLKNLNIMDYSLLIGRQKIHRAEKKPCLPKMMPCLDKSNNNPLPESGRLSADGSLPDDKTPRLSPNNHRSATAQLPGAVTSEIPPFPSSSPPPHTSPHPHPHPHPYPHSHPYLVTLSENGAAPIHKNGLHAAPHSPSAVDDRKLLNGSGCDLVREGRRLRPLPDCPNALHVVDGAEYRYFFGIVDILTQWTLRMKVMRLLKCCFGNHSTMPPDFYSQRFIAFFNHRTYP